MSSPIATTLPTRARTAIIGGGIMGLALAYELARRGERDIVVLEKSYLCSGASGRNGGGVRAQWASELNIRLMKESLEICASFATTMRMNVWFRRGGYLFLARTPAHVATLEASSALQRKHGVRTEIISPGQARAEVPELSIEGVLAASFNPDDAVVFPWPFLWGYARAAAALGVSVVPFCQVDALETRGDRVHQLRLSSAKPSRGGPSISLLEVERVVCATGAWSPQLLTQVGVDLPTRPHRHEICASEPLKPFLGPLVAELQSGLYFSQSMRGEIVGGLSNEDVAPGLDQESSLGFLSRYGREMVRTVPRFGHLKIVRQWAGCYDLTPDGSPIVGFIRAPENLFLLSGFMGNGFMIAPVIARRCAEYLTGQPPDPLFARWTLERFERGELIPESMILG